MNKDTEIRKDRFLQEVNQTYAHLAIKKQVLDQGYIIESESVTETGEIALVVCEPM